MYYNRTPPVRIYGTIIPFDLIRGRQLLGTWGGEAEWIKKNFPTPKSA